MLKDITIGQFYPADSVIHRLDPRVKLVGTILYIVCVFLAKGTIGFALLVAIPVILTGMAKVPYRMLLKGLRAIWPLIAITAACNLFFAAGETEYWNWKFLHLSDAGIHNAIFYTVRLILLVAGTSLMTLTTSPGKLTDGMETGLRPLARIGIPVHEIAMMMSIALRFIPILGEEAEKIKKAQTARGAVFDEGSIFARAKAFIPILVPLFVSAFQRAQDLALAMEARCYHGGEGRTKLHPLRYTGADRAAYVILAAVFVIFILLRIWDLPFPV